VGLTENSVNSARWQRLTAFSVPLLPTALIPDVNANAGRALVTPIKCERRLPVGPLQLTS